MLFKNSQTRVFKAFLVLIVLVISSCSNVDSDDNQQIEDILTRINAIEGVTATEIETVDHFTRLFEVRILQPIDHNNPTGDKFYQKIYIGHVDENLPVAFEIEGYSRSSHRTREISGLLSINQIAVEHRFNGESVPDNIDWQYLTVWQAANDHHRIVTLFKEIYDKAWVSSGTSKGGDTAIFHRRFFPGDVEATVAYVAPILFEEYDTRFLTYYDTQGDEACRQRMKDFQRNMLINIDSFSPLFENYVDEVNEIYGTNITFSLPYEAIVYFATREDYPFEFWSSEIENCNTIPENDATVEELFNHFVNVFDIFLFFSDYGADFWTPWYYQSKTEIGSYAFDVSHLEDLEMAFDPLVDLGVTTTFNPATMTDIANWFSTSASNTILIYGEDDPWTVASFDYQGPNDVVKIINPGTKHGTRISSLSAGDQALVLDKLNLWLEINQ